MADPSIKFENTYMFSDINGIARTIINKKNLLYDAQNKARFMVGGLLDITEYESIKNKAKVHQEQLLLADKMKSLGILISGVAHEINNPNHFININVVLLQKMWERLKTAFL